MWSALRFVCAIAIVLASSRVAADGSPQLAALAPPPGDDARRAVALGPAGEVYEPDGAGAWVRTQRFSTSSTLVVAGRAGGEIVASGGGVVYKLAANGWTAIRLAQKGAAVMSSGPRAVAAVGRQLFRLDRTKAGEPEKLAVAGGAVLAIGSGKGVVISTEGGLFRVDGTKLTAIAGAPKQVTKLVGDVWALDDRGVVDLRSNKTTRWPASLTVAVAATGPDDSFVGVGTNNGSLELVTLRGGKLEEIPIVVTPTGVPVGVAVDRAGRAVVALGDGRLLVRAGTTWTTATVRETLPAPRPGPAPAVSM